MPIKYCEAPEIKKQVDELAEELELFHVVPQFVYCVRSRGSKAKRTIARIHGLGRLWQDVLNTPPSYTIEVISEIYDKMSPVEKEKTLIHELLHIPGIGPKSADAIMMARRKEKIASPDLLHTFGVNLKRAAPYIAVNGKTPAQQLSFF